jgi:AraC family transcriptional activator of tynA and feaB
VFGSDRLERAEIMWRADIAASTESCFYLNFKLAGRCRMLQGDRDVSLSRGQVGICDSDREVALLHRQARA